MRQVFVTLPGAEPAQAAAATGSFVSGSKELGCCGAGQVLIGTYRAISSEAVAEDLTEGGCVFPGCPARRASPSNSTNRKFCLVKGSSR